MICENIVSDLIVIDQLEVLFGNTRFNTLSCVFWLVHFVASEMIGHY